jgi:putative transposase
MFIGCSDGLTGLPEALERVSPQTRVQLCMVHMLRNWAQLRLSRPDEGGRY